jgi:hypothetical protein
MDTNPLFHEISQAGEPLRAPSSISDHNSYALSSAVESYLHRTSIPGHSDALQRPVHVLFKLV